MQIELLKKQNAIWFFERKTKCHILPMIRVIFGPSERKGLIFSCTVVRIVFRVIWNIGHHALPLTCHVDIDGTYFGTTFTHLFLMTYPHLKPQKPAQQYIPRVFGFKIHKPWEIWRLKMLKIHLRSIAPCELLVSVCVLPFIALFDWCSPGSSNVHIPSECTWTPPADLHSLASHLDLIILIWCLWFV